jgi:D-alanyl-D-alanine carboxypeptidase
MTAIFSYLRTWRFRRRIASLHAELGIPRDYARRRALPPQPEARGLVVVGPDIYDREQRLLAPAAAAWHAMVEAAARDGVELQLVSAYRSVSYQEGIVRKKLQCGQAIEEILCVSAAPGFSEHHSGRAVDLTTPGYAVLEEEFEDSAAFAWLSTRAADFGFQLSYPRDNPHGVAHEPWHWAWCGDRSK